MGSVLPKQLQQLKAFEGSHREITIPKSPKASYSVDLNANDNQVHVDMKTSSSSNRPTGRKKEKIRKMLKVEKTHLPAKIYEGNNEIIKIFKRDEKRRDKTLAEMAKELNRCYQLMGLQVENECNKYE